VSEGVVTVKNYVLINLRKELNLTQEEAAKQIGIAPSTLAMLELGKRSGRDWVKRKVADFYKRSVDEIFFTDDTHVECVKSATSA
jgi:putative transcriptional regulator